MHFETLGVTREQAKEKYREYKAHRHWSAPIDIEIQRTYQRIAQGRTVIRAFESIKAAGLDATGRPKLAIVRADAKECEMEIGDRGRVMFRDKEVYGSVHWERGNESKSRLLRIDDAFPDAKRISGRAIVPLIPVHLRPKRGLENYHILWEADWKVIPVDPVLLRRIGRGDLWLVCAAWDLTEVERAALGAHLSKP